MMAEARWRQLSLLGALILAGCAQSVPSGDVDANAYDSGGVNDAAADALVPPDASPDAAPGEVTICQACSANADCLPDHLCVLTGMGRLCLPSCTPSSPDCPTGFTCGGVKATFCAPVDGVCCVDGDDDAYGEGAGCLGPDCDDLNQDINPGELELCNDVDDDCNPATLDGSGDPLVGVACDGADTDLCAEGTSSCGTGGTVSCSDNSGNDVDLCNGMDDDCNPNSADGSADPLVGIACDGADTDLCAEGVSTCNGASGVACSDMTGSTIELCNGADDDCNPNTADGSGDPSLGGPCDGTDGDLCLEGTLVCSMGAPSCSDATSTNIELCNGMDDDCNGNTADGSGDVLVGVPCDGADGDRCLEGLSSCGATGIECSDNSGTTVDLCNGSDDDCDPNTADGSAEPTLGNACDGNDGDLCAEGVLVCSGAGGLSCNDSSGTTVDLCNGFDDDCDPSSADGSEDPAIGGGCDGGDADLCLEGVLLCMSGGPVCNDNSGDSVEICNDLDDDCDGTPDETFDKTSDPLNCGSCNTVCSGLCCGSGCQTSNATNCGACGRTCSEVNLVINEIMIRPGVVVDAAGEWFEVRNLSSFDVDMRGFVLSDAGTETHTITRATPVIVPAGGYIVLGRNADTGSNGGVTVDYQYGSFQLGNSGDEIIITAFGTVIDRVDYTTNFDTQGKSQELSVNHQNATANDTLTNWCDAVTAMSGGDLGTPGAPNVCSL